MDCINSWIQRERETNRGIFYKIHNLTQLVYVQTHDVHVLFSESECRRCMRTIISHLFLLSFSIPVHNIKVEIVEARE